MLSKFSQNHQLHEFFQKKKKYKRQALVIESSWFAIKEKSEFPEKISQLHTTLSQSMDVS
jgi:hypothetical protein